MKFGASNWVRRFALLSAMTTDGMDHFFAHATFAQQFGSLDAMLLRVLLKVDVVQQPDNSPEIHFVGKAQLTGIPAHDSLHRQRMLQVERVLVPSPM